MAGGKRLSTRGRKLSLRRRREIQKKEEQMAYQQDLTTNAMDFIMGFIIPRLMSSVNNSTSLSQSYTITIEKNGTTYFFQQGRYKGLLPFDPINDEIIEEALTLAYGYELVPERTGGKASFSMLIE